MSKLKHSEDDYPAWICMSCGWKLGKAPSEKAICTFHNGTCDVCKTECAVTEPRDFGHLKNNWRELKNA